MSDEADILNQLDTMNFAQTETGLPVLRAGLVKVRVAKMEIVPNSRKDGNNVKVQLTLVDPWESTKGTPVAPGFPLFSQISLKPTEKYTQASIHKALAEFMECFLGTKDGKFMPLEQFINTEGTIAVKPEDTTDFGPQTRIQRYVKKA